MSALSALLDATAAPTRQPRNTDEMPTVSSTAPVGASQLTTTSLQQYGSVGWLFGATSLIAETAAAVEWEWKRYPNGAGAGDAQAVEATDHPLIHLWEWVSPESDGFEFRETCYQHFTLVGEMWWLLIYPSEGAPFPTELMPIRPDRIRPVPDATGRRRAGYVYSYGAHRIPLSLDDVVFIKRPDPMHPGPLGRGLGAVQAIIATCEGERAATIWAAKFFSNGALPGGIIEYPEGLSDTEFEEANLRWQEQHRGENNAWRVAIIERGKWVDRKFSERDFHLGDYRNLNRDIIFGMLHIPHSVMGLQTAGVRASNAKEDQENFNRYVINPLCRRAKLGLNKRLIPMTGERNLVAHYVDPTPEDRELKAKIAQDAWLAGGIKKSEYRKDMGFPEDPSDPENDSYYQGQPVTLKPSTESLVPTDLVIPRIFAQADCGHCGKMLGRNVNVGADLFCHECAKARIVNAEGIGWGPKSRREALVGTNGSAK